MVKKIFCLLIILILAIIISWWNYIPPGFDFHTQISPYPSDISFVIGTINNQTHREITYGDAWFLQQNYYSFWRTIPDKNEVFYRLALWKLDSHTLRQDNFYLNTRYGDLPPGQYRVKRIFYLQTTWGRIPFQAYATLTIQ